MGKYALDKYLLNICPVTACVKSVIKICEPKGNMIVRWWLNVFVQLEFCLAVISERTERYGICCLYLWFAFSIKGKYLDIKKEESVQ